MIFSRIVADRLTKFRGQNTRAVEVGTHTELKNVERKTRFQARPISVQKELGFAEN